MPVYNAHKLAEKPSADVLIVEGEKAADAAQILFPDLLGSTWHAKAVTKTLWEQLANRHVTIWPDNDEAGESAAQAVVNELRRVGCRSISVVDAKSLAGIDPNHPNGGPLARHIVTSRKITILRPEVIHMIGCSV